MKKEWSVGELAAIQKPGEPIAAVVAIESIAELSKEYFGVRLVTALIDWSTWSSGRVHIARKPGESFNAHYTELWVVPRRLCPEDEEKRNMNMQVAKTFEFSAAHFLPDHPKCGRMHGHTYKLEVTVSGTVDRSGMVIDFGELSGIVHDCALSQLDHSYLNAIPGLENPTAETLCAWIWLRIEKQVFIAGARQLFRVRVWETSTSYAQMHAWDAFEEAHT